MLHGLQWVGGGCRRHVTHAASSGDGRRLSDDEREDDARR